MACTKLSVMMLLLLSGMVLFAELQSSTGGVMACPLYCLDVKYVTCTSSGDKKLPATCNCCLTPKDCTLHLSDGTQLSCS
ncbi:uncharacterized protein [Elaeis guineensis]|uniref:uncharacterized protein n=1 Tax=Elaeis guineensis var. tenera TaxID=51953 RepID=UPI003C6D574F